MIGFLTNKIDSQVETIALRDFQAYKSLIQQRDEVLRRGVDVKSIGETLILGLGAAAVLGNTHEAGYVVGGTATLYLLHKKLQDRATYRRLEAQLADMDLNLSHQ